MYQLGQLCHVPQSTDSDCGLACLAMLLAVPLAKVKEAFLKLNLEYKHGSRRSGKKRYSTNGKDLQTVADYLGFHIYSNKFTGWGCLKVPAILRANKRGFDWHWVIAEPHPEFGMIVLDPALDIPGILENPPLNQAHYNLDLWKPYGMMLQIIDKCR